MNEVQMQFEVARDQLENTIEELEQLKVTMSEHPELKATIARMDNYIIPHLTSWLTRGAQSGSFAEIAEDIKEAFEDASIQDIMSTYQCSYEEAEAIHNFDGAIE